MMFDLGSSPSSLSVLYEFVCVQMSVCVCLVCVSTAAVAEAFVKKKDFFSRLHKTVYFREEGGLCVDT